MLKTNNLFLSKKLYKNKKTSLLLKLLFFKPVQPDVQEGPVMTIFVVNLLWQGSYFSLQLMMFWKQGCTIYILT